MFCFQCQETARNSGCTIRGVCGKGEETAHLQDMLIFSLKGLGRVADATGVVESDVGRLMAEALFTTITNANFDNDRIVDLISRILEKRDHIREGLSDSVKRNLPSSATWSGRSMKDFLALAPSVGVLATENGDIRSLRELLIYGMKGIAAYAHHAAVLGYEEENIYRFLARGLAATTQDVSADELVALVMEAGKTAVDTMALLDRANTETYGNPEPTKVNIGVRKNPGILVSGHDLKDMETLLEQTKGTGVDIYTHSEMLPANSYPAFKKYDHLAGNYGGSWWKQGEEFSSFNGPILMTTNCIIPVKDAYRDRIYTTGCAGYPGVTHIPDPKPGGIKDFSIIIEQAKTCAPPTKLETGEITGGFAHHQLSALADTIVDAVKSGALRRFVVMAGCDGRFKDREYFTDVAERLPNDTVILTAGCAKYRYNKLPLGDIGGIPRVIDAGQCNDSYSLALTALKLAEVLGVDDINDLPISFDIAWYEQKAVAVLLALLSLGVKGIRLGPTLPAFLSPRVAQVLVEKFDIKPTGDVKGDIAAMMEGN
ncbi:MAG: hydroxylamine reductase [Deltaproteobacteria bacterium]|nr:hydroxylamine reductase [Candidatus Zymogenaceae bacterium]